MGDGAIHDVQNNAWMMAGQCQGYYETGQCLPSTGKTIGNVLADVCNAMGAPVEYFGDETYGKPWDGLRA